MKIFAKGSNMKKLVCTFLVGMMLFFLTACLIRPINRDNILPDTFYSQELGVGVRLDMNKKQWMKYVESRNVMVIFMFMTGIFM